MAFQYQYPIVPVSIYLELFVFGRIIDFAYAFGTAHAIGIFLN